ncbi:AimR family lysis-lysogeny pheromone receptor [Pontibacillus yanchengensis]|uniref:Uncharacterized protein n=1 Tax=Pontibacillus yanchengensis Y32 TaxID=1385514 RepID=A0A0A2TJJ0_9BACI|nr:AimR family lysis-lysogeny pheromone receptor [Pontibacillus yanchengensis]KGP74241.1 hypothetical protein N782_08970 [Pontibacillus yanchengensis Y32]
MIQPQHNSSTIQWHQWTEEDVKRAIAPFLQEGVEASLQNVQRMFSVQYDAEVTAQLMKALCLQTNCDLQQRHALEYMYMNAFFQELLDMIEKNKASSNQTNQQWAFIYELIWNRIAKKPDPNLTLQQIKQLTPLDEGAQVLQTFLIQYSYFDLLAYGEFGNYYQRLVDQVSGIDSPFLSYYFQLRLEDFQFYYHWKRNEVIIARKHAFRALNKTMSSFKKCHLHVALAESYSITDYDQAIFHMNEALKIADHHQFGIRDAIRTRLYPFVSAVHQEMEGVTTTDLPEQAHLAAARGDTAKVQEILDDFESLTPFQEYYLGLATQSVRLLTSSYRRLMNEYGDYYYAMLPFQELQRIKTQNTITL